MDIRDRRSLKTEAKSALGTAVYSPGKLVLIHTGIMAAMTLLFIGADLLLQSFIASTGGLSGMGMRSVLSTVQSLLGMLSSAVLPVWSVCYYFAALRLSRRELAAPDSLMDGLRNLGPLVRLLLIACLLMFCIGMLCYMPSAGLYLLTPAAQTTMEALGPAVNEAVASGSTSIVLDETAMAAAAGDGLLMLLILLLVTVVACVPVFYRLYLAVYALADDPKAGALAALRKSMKLTKGNAMNLFRIDLSFWWFYVLEALAVALSYGDDLLYMAGVPLPLSETAAVLLFQALSLAGQMALYYFAKNKVLVTHAVAYDVLQSGRETVPPAAKKQPWSKW